MNSRPIYGGYHAATPDLIVRDAQKAIEVTFCSTGPIVPGSLGGFACQRVWR